MSVEGITASLFGEAWTGFSAPPVSGLRDISRAIEEVAQATDGRPVFRLDWAPDLKCFRGGRHGQYQHLIYRGDHGRVVIPLPRWVVSQYIPDAIGKPDWNNKRFEYATVIDHKTSLPIVQEIDLLGPYPEKGWYQLIHTIADHVPTKILPGCCDQKSRMGRQCYGLYLAPSWPTIDIVRRSWHQFYTHATHRPDQMPTPEQLDQRALTINNQLDEGDQAFAREFREGAQEVLHPFDNLRAGIVRSDVGSAWDKHHKNEVLK